VGRPVPLVAAGLDRGEAAVQGHLGQLLEFEPLYSLRLSWVSPKAQPNLPDYQVLTSGRSEISFLSSK
jgi:hypothetical protein